MQKKAFELSINMLIVIILSIAIISMGLVFFKKVFEDSEKMVNTYDEQTKQEMERMLSAGEKVAIPFPNKEIEAGKEAIFGLGILNVLELESQFTVKKICKKMDTTSTVISCDKFTDELYVLISQPPSIKNNEEYKMPIVVETQKSTPSGQYVIDVYVCSGTCCQCDGGSTGGTCTGECTTLDCSSPTNCPTNLYDGYVHKLYVTVI